jgi:hypothetical protein
MLKDRMSLDGSTAARTRAAMTARAAYPTVVVLVLSMGCDSNPSGPSAPSAPAPAIPSKTQGPSKSNDRTNPLRQVGEPIGALLPGGLGVRRL